MSIDAKRAEDAERYVRGYLELETQAPDEGNTDPQLAAVSLKLAEMLASHEAGAIIDIGSGQGTLLTKLFDLPDFVKKDRWVYVAVDTDESLTSVQTIARNRRASRRAELIELDSFYEAWPHISENQIIFCRNVLHELNITETAKLIYHICRNASSEDTIVIQDLSKLPVGEHHSACWIPENLKECLENCGLQDVVLVKQPTRSGNSWFSITAKNRSENNYDAEHIRQQVIKARQAQWSLWSTIDHQAVSGIPQRSELVESLDLNLQLAALTRQLSDGGVEGLLLSPTAERKVRYEEFQKKIVEFIAEDRIEASTKPVDRGHFRERGEQLTVLEEFLRGQGRVAVVWGGVGTGKTTLVNRLLSTRAYNKVPVVIDGRRTKSFWGLVEEVFGQVGLRLAPELLSVLSDLTINKFEVALRQFANACVGKIILFYDNFEEVQNPDRSLSDQGVAAFLELWASRPSAKIIFGSRSEFLPREVQEAGGGLPASVQVRRYASDQTVVNVLDDSFDRRAAGLSEYPEELISAIDRHPLITALAAQNLKKHGASLLLDAKFVAELRGQMRSELWNRLVDFESSPAIEVASQLRIPVPLEFFDKFVSRSSVRAAQQAELIYQREDNRWGEILATLGLFRVRMVRDGTDVIESASRESSIDHRALADAYRYIYQLDDDPKWIRESYFHLMLSGAETRGEISGALGLYYYDELIASADYDYVKRRDFESALSLYETAAAMKPLRENAEMRRASCLIRVNKRELGERAYRSLINRFPDSRGIKTSFVDALLYKAEFDAAKGVLEEYELTPSQNRWTAYEWGRTHLGLDNYSAAVEVFADLVGNYSDDLHFHIHYARALQYMGKFDEAESTLKAASEHFPDMYAVLTALGTTLEQNGKHDEAFDILQPLFAERSDNVQAAASLVRICRHRGDRAAAISLLRKAEHNAPKQFLSYVIAAKCEVRMLDKQYDVVPKILDQLTEANAYAQFIGFRALRECAELLGEEAGRKLARDALGRPFAMRFRKNVPIQNQRARLAEIAGLQGVLDGIRLEIST